jgi:parallel beta-helix repeat protein
VRNNRIEDVFAADKPGASSYGIYLDEGSSDVLVEKNLVRRTTGGGFHLNYGKDNTVRNNIFMESRGAELDRGNKDNATVLIERNVLVSDGHPLFAGAWGDPGANVRNNVTIESRSASTREHRAQGTAEMDCDAVNCKVLSSRVLQSGFANFSVSDAGIADRGSVLNTAR